MIKYYSKEDNIGFFVSCKKKNIFIYVQTIAQLNEKEKNETLVLHVLLEDKV